jgi:hypothetical protein
VPAMPLADLDGLATSGGRLRVADRKRGRFPEEEDAVLCLDNRRVAHVKHFRGRASARVNPWIEASLVGADEALAAELVRALAELLPPGGYVMVGYGDDETERALKRRFPPVATPLGKALYDAGATWFKDWYYPEGWLEGGMKLQANKPLSAAARQAHVEELRAELEEWLARVERSDDELVVRARRRAEAVLAGG